MTTIRDLEQAIHTIAPKETAMSFDNVGLLVGDANASVTKVLLSLDVTKDVVAQAEEAGAQLIISHHPVIFQPLKRLTADSLPYLLAQKGLSVISAHTNYDLAAEGVNYCLAQALGLSDIRPFVLDKNTGLAEGLLGTLPEAMEPELFAVHVKESLSCGGIKFTQGDRPVKTVAVGCGAGSYLVFDAMASGADGFVTGESKHHEQLAAKEGGITLVDAGHFNTENIAMEPLLRKLQAQFPEVTFQLAAQTEPVFYL